MANLDVYTGVDYEWHALVSQHSRRLMAFAVRQPDVQHCGGGRVILEEPICLG